jgi:hypothetical protein
MNENSNLESQRLKIERIVVPKIDLTVDDLS